MISTIRVMRGVQASAWMSQLRLVQDWQQRHQPSSMRANDDRHGRQAGVQENNPNLVRMCDTHHRKTGN